MTVVLDLSAIHEVLPDIGLQPKLLCCALQCG